MWQHVRLRVDNGLPIHIWSLAVDGNAEPTRTPAVAQPILPKGTNFSRYSTSSALTISRTVVAHLHETEEHALPRCASSIAGFGKTDAKLRAFDLSPVTLSFMVNAVKPCKCEAGRGTESHPHKVVLGLRA